MTSEQVVIEHGPATELADVPQQVGDDGLIDEADGGWRYQLRRQQRFLLGVLGFVLMFGSWQLASDLELVNPLYVSSPVAVFQAAVEYIPTAEFVEDLKASGSAFGWGLLLSVTVGVGLGIAMGWYRVIYYLLDPLLSFIYSLPRVAFIPLTIIWFGIGVSSKAALIFIMAVFPVLINTVAGVRSVDRGMIDMGRSFCANDRAIFRTIVLPSAIPTILAGLRLAIGYGLIGVAVGELFASKDGLGNLIAEGGTRFRIDIVFMGTFILGFFGVGMAQIIKRLEKRLDRWRPELKS